MTGYGTSVGTHTLTATAVDNVDNTTVDTRSYTVDPWTMKGFYQPVDISGATPVWNTVKNGSTVPLKFEVFAGETELTATSAIVQPLKATNVPCSGNVADDIELTATGGTLLRYDATAGQFIFDWHTPKRASTCWRVDLAAADGASSLTAYFRLK